LLLLAGYQRFAVIKFVYFLVDDTLQAGEETDYDEAD
jgi:hypothetical protein